MIDKNEEQLLDRLRELERRIDELAASIEQQLRKVLDEDLKIRGLK